MAWVWKNQHLIEIVPVSPSFKAILLYISSSLWPALPSKKNPADLSLLKQSCFSLLSYLSSRKCNVTPPLLLGCSFWFPLKNQYASPLPTSVTSACFLPQPKQKPPHLYQKPLLQVTENAPLQRLLQIPSFTGVSSSLAYSIALAESIATSLEAARGSRKSPPLGKENDLQKKWERAQMGSTNILHNK